MPKSTKHAKAKKLIHPNSRKAHKVGAKEIHNDKVKKVHRATSLKQSVQQEKMLWVKEHLDEEKTIYSKQELCELVERYLERFDEEMEQINIIQGISARKSNQHAPRESAIRLTLQKEITDFETCGIEMPDLCNGKILKILKAWQGEAKYLQNIKLRRVKKLTETESNENQEDEVGEDEDIQGEEELKEFVDEDDDRSKLDEGSKKDDEDMEDKT
ncbi:translation machinery-associated protein 16-like [Apostichopus japonicus]|uniref:translation machinery-associated protein 16-like n=1 Tax=Stichopus japonicus TaxID=307972 RepID=UPI003AB458C1